MYLFTASDRERKALLAHGGDRLSLLISYAHLTYLSLILLFLLMMWDWKKYAISSQTGGPNFACCTRMLLQRILKYQP